MFSLNAYTLCTIKMQNDMGKKRKKKFLTAPPHSITWYSQEPINSQDKTDVISGQSHRGQHHQHSDETSTRDTGSSYTGTRGCQAKTKKKILKQILMKPTLWKIPIWNTVHVWYKLFFEKFTMLFEFWIIKNMNKSWSCWHYCSWFIKY